MNPVILGASQSEAGKIFSSGTLLQAPLSRTA